MLNNYLVWKALDRYNHELSSEYLHIKRQFYVDRYDDDVFDGLSSHCFKGVQSHFGMALGSLFIRDQFNERNKKEVLVFLQSEHLW